MQNISLKSIKWESIKAIFHSISRAKTISRADISAETGLSLMTVGKVADALLSMNIVHQTKETHKTAGRRAGVLSINPEHFALILDLTSRSFIMTVINIRLEIVEKHHYAFNDDFTFEENLSLFLKDAYKFLSTAANADKCIGIGVSLPGAYLKETDRVVGDRLPELSGIPICETVRRVFSDMPLYIEAGYNAAATSNISTIPNHRDKVILYWFIGENNICGTIVEGGEILRGAHNTAGNFGEMMVGRGRTLQSAIKTSNPPEENASMLARAIYNVMMTVDPDRIILECELYKNRDEFVELVHKCLLEQFPASDETIPLLTNSTCKFRHSHRGLTMKLTEAWLSHLVFDDTKK